MEKRQTRGEIRRRVQVSLGHVTGGLQAGLTLDLLNELIREAQAEIIVEWREWQPAVKEHIVTIGVDQSFVDYPPNSSGGSIIEVAVWDNEKLYYRRLLPRRIGLEMDDDALEELMLEADAAGDQDEVDRLSAADYAKDGFPRWYEQRNQLKIDPPSDEVRKLKYLYVECVELTDDAQESQVDADLILYKALEEAFARQGDDTLAARQRSRYEKRLGQLKHWHHTLETAEIGQADKDEIRAKSPRRFLRPNYDTSPSVPIDQPIPGE